MSTVNAMARLLRAERALGTAAREIAAARVELQGGPPRGPGQEVLQRLGAWLRAYRDAQGLSRDALAARAGLSKGTLKNLERGAHVPTATTLDLLRRGLPLPADLLAQLERRR